MGCRSKIMNDWLKPKEVFAPPVLGLQPNSTEAVNPVFMWTIITELVRPEDFFVVPAIRRLGCSKNRQPGLNDCWPT